MVDEAFRRGFRLPLSSQVTGKYSQIREIFSSMMYVTFDHCQQTSLVRCSRGNVSGVGDGLSNVAIGWWQTKRSNADGEAAMATVYVVTAGSGDTYRIERVYLDRDEADRFAQDYNGIAPVEPVQVEEWEDRCPAGGL